MIIDLENLDLLVQGQTERSLAAATRKIYINNVKTFITKLQLVPALKEEAFDLNEDGSYKYHIGEASHLLKLKLPMTPRVIKAGFAIISVDPSMAKKKKRKVDTAKK